MVDRQNLPRPTPEDVLRTGDPLEDTLGAEEAAMQVVDEPAGMNDGPAPGYVDHDAEGAS